MKQEYPVPEGTTVSVTQENNKVVIEFLPKKFEPKDGDIVRVYVRYGNGSYIICFYESPTQYATGLSTEKELFINGLGINEGNIIEPATDSEKHQLFNALEKAGYTWNAEKKKVEKFRWKPKNGEDFYFCDPWFKPLLEKFSNGYQPHIRMVEISNCFKTHQECQSYCDFMREKSKEYHESK